MIRQQKSGIPPKNKDAIAHVRIENDKQYLKEIEDLKSKIYQRVKRVPQTGFQFYH